MIWGFITSKGNFKIFRCSTKLNSTTYIKLSENNALEAIKDCDFKLSDIVFMQDNASCHNSKKNKRVV